MNDLLRYLIFSSVSLALLYCVYGLFLRKDTFFTVNRYYLLGSIIFSLTVPIFDIRFEFSPAISGYIYLLETITITPEKIDSTISNNLNISEGFIIAYITGAALFSLRFLFQLSQLALLIKRSGITRKDGMNLVFIRRNYSPFSFFNLVFIGKQQIDSPFINKILEHEKVHIQQKHSLDLLLVEIMTIIFWFNPFIWFYRSSVKVLHEYLADEGVLLKGFDRTDYQENLLSQGLGIQVNDLTNNFNHSLLKMRIMMMTKKRSHRLSKWKAAFAIPVVIAITMVFSASVNLSFGQDQTKTSKTTDVKEVPPPPPVTNDPSVARPVKNEQEELVYTVVKKMPEFKGGYDGLVKYMLENIKYPEEAKKKGIVGRVFVSFVVDKSGKVLNPKILHSVDPLLDAEALRVVGNMPNWNPGLDDNGNAVNVKFNLPIKFSLDTKKKTEENK